MSNTATEIQFGPCSCGGYGQVFDAETQRETGRCHDPMKPKPDASLENLLVSAADPERAGTMDRYVVASLAERAVGAIRALERDVGALRRVFAHNHVGPADACGSCGLNIRDPIHRRAATPEQEPSDGR